MLAAVKWISLALGVAILSGSSAQGQTVSDRVRLLEQKTDYFLKKNRKVQRTYSKPRAAPASSSTAASAECTPESIPMTFNPNIVSGGTAHAWLTATVRYSGNPVNVFVNWGPPNFGFPCGKAENSPGPGGTVVLKQYCSFDVSVADKFVARFGTGVGCPGTQISTIDATMKFTLIEVVEPE
jgi:hypothetical protein